MTRMAIRAGLIRSFATLFASAAAALSAAACASSTGPNGGVLTVTITTPQGVTPNVTVRGPNGFVRSLSASATLRGLAAGSYAVTAASVTVTDPIVNTISRRYSHGNARVSRRTTIDGDDCHVCATGRYR